MPGVFPDYPAPVVRNAAGESELTYDALCRLPRALAHQYPQHNLASLAALAKARKPLPGPVQQLRRIRAGTEPGDKKERRGLVCAKRRQTADRVRWHLDRVQRRSWHQVKTDPRPSPRVRLHDDGTERDRRTDPSQSHAILTTHEEMRRLDARAVG
jgi:hypothetical protein